MKLFLIGMSLFLGIIGHSEFGFSKTMSLTCGFRLQGQGCSASPRTDHLNLDIVGQTFSLQEHRDACFFQSVIQATGTSSISKENGQILTFKLTNQFEFTDGNWKDDHKQRIVQIDMGTLKGQIQFPEISGASSILRINCHRN